MKTRTETEYIQQLISEGEHIQQDFKFAISDARKIARSISAFANTQGGRLLIGVKDNGKIAGVRSEEEIYMIEAAARMYCRPQVELENRQKESVVIAYTEREQHLLNILKQHGALTLNQCSRLSQINRKQTSELLADFIRFGLVEQDFKEHTFYFKLTENE